MAVVAQDHRLFVFLGGDDGHALAAAERPQKHFIGDDIEFLLNFALDVLRADAAQNVFQARASHLVRDNLR